MPHTVAARINRWILEAYPNENIQEIWELVQYFAQQRYFEYKPTFGPFPDFMQRLRNWLDCLRREQDQQILFRLLPHIFFVTVREFESLYRTAFKGVIAQWLIDELMIRFNQDDLTNIINRAAQETWFCPITDSMHIADFCHINRIEGQELRPDWLTLMKLGENQKILDYITGARIKRLVMLEDFVGSGIQIEGIVSRAATLLDSISILVVPLIVCPDGTIMGERLQSRFPNIKFSPVLRLSPRNFLTQHPDPMEPELFRLIRELIVRIESLVKTPTSVGPYYGPFGFQDTGALVVPYSNCPDNTLPLIHYESETWQPIFPRSTRVNQ